MKTVMMMAASFAVLASSNAFGAINGTDPNLVPGKAAQVAGEKPCQYASDVRKNKKTENVETVAAKTSEKNIAR